MAKVSIFSVITSVAIFALISTWISVGRSEQPARWDDEGGRFKPIVEADLPEGFPTYTPVGHIEVKRYVAYRKAETSGRAAFWSLFSHIKRNQIAMTAPVEMTLRSEGTNRLGEQSMAFLYGNPNMGSPGLDGRVSVLDVSAMAVVSIGVRGARTDEAVNEAQERLQRWLDAHRANTFRLDRCESWDTTAPSCPEIVSFLKSRFRSRRMVRSLMRTRITCLPHHRTSGDLSYLHPTNRPIALKRVVQFPGSRLGWSTPCRPLGAGGNTPTGSRRGLLACARAGLGAGGNTPNRLSPGAPRGSCWPRHPNRLSPALRPRAGLGAGGNTPNRLSPGASRVPRAGLGAGGNTPNRLSPGASRAVLA